MKCELRDPGESCALVKLVQFDVVFGVPVPVEVSDSAQLAVGVEDGARFRIDRLAGRKQRGRVVDTVPFKDLGLENLSIYGVGSKLAVRVELFVDRISKLARELEQVSARLCF